jgi:hypothetical protein
MYTVGLKLDNQTRFIGKLDRAGAGTSISNGRTEKHLLKKLNAIGINRELCERFTFRWLLVPYCGHRLLTSRLYLLKYGKALTFHRAGFECQLFLPLQEWDIEKAESFERTLELQGDLFGGAAA